MGESLSQQLEAAFEIGQPEVEERPKAAPEAAQQEPQPDGLQQPEMAEEEEAPADAGDDGLHESEETEAGDGESQDGVYLSEVAKQLGIGIEDLYDVRVKTGDGQELTIGELKDIKQGTYHKPDVEAERQEIEQYRQQVVAQAQKERDEILQQAQTIGAVPEKVMALQAELMGLERQYQAVPWDEIAKEDPGRASYLKQQFSEQSALIQGNLNQARQEAKITQDEEYQKKLQAANAEFARHVPEWRDEAVRNREVEMISKLAGEYDITPQQMGATIDPRLRRVFRDYALLKARYASANANAKKVVKRGNQVLRDAVRKSVRHDQDAEDKYNRAKKTGNRKDLNAAVDALLEL